MNRPDTDAQDQLLQIITFGLQRAAGPYRWAKTRRTGLSKNYLCSIIVLVAVRLGRTLPGWSGQIVPSRESWRQIFRAK